MNIDIVGVCVHSMNFCSQIVGAVREAVTEVKFLFLAFLFLIVSDGTRQ